MNLCRLLGIIIIALVINTVHAEGKTRLNPVFVVTDINGNSMEVTNLQILVIRGSDQNLTTSFSVNKGDAQVTVNMEDIMGLRNYWKDNKVELYFPNRSHFVASLPDGVKFHEIKGRVLLGGKKMPYVLAVPKLLSVFRKGFTPPADKTPKGQ